MVSSTTSTDPPGLAGPIIRCSCRRLVSAKSVSTGCPTIREHVECTRSASAWFAYSTMPSAETVAAPSDIPSTKLR